MAGISLKINSNSSVNQMTDSLLITPFLEKKDIYTDNNIEISQVSLKKNKFKSLCEDDIVIFVEGYVYNIDELNEIWNISKQSFSELLKEAYKNNFLKELLNKADGFFNAVIYDKTKKKVFLISDRLGTRFLYWYHKDNVFAVSGEVKGILSLNDIDKSIDKTSLECFVNGGQNFYIPGYNTLFKYIKLIKPASILEYDINKNTVKQSHYWTFNEIKQQNIPYENAIDILHDLIKKAVLRRVKDIPSSEIMLPLSGGLDSRLIFAILNNNKKMPDFIYTNGVNKCTDVVFAKKLCKKFGIRHNINLPIKHSNYIKDGFEPAYISDGMITFIEMNTFNPITEYHYTISGYVGDMVFGASFKDDKTLFDTKMNVETAQKFYGKFYELTDFEDEYFNINKIEASLFINRVRRYTAQMLNYSCNNIEILLPYIDNKIIDFIYSLPDSYRAENYLYSDMLLKYYPEYYKDIPCTGKNLPINGNLYKSNNFIYKLENKVNNSNLLSKKWKKSFIKRINRYLNVNNFMYKNTFHTFQEELTNQNSINLIKKEFINEQSLLKDYVESDTWADIFLYINNKDAWKIGLILTAEFYLRELKSKKII